MYGLTSAIALTALVSLSACSSGGNESIKNETGASIDQKIQDGVTTKEQVRSQFGDPAAVSFTDSGHEQWKYSFTNASSDAANFIPVYGDLHQSSHGTEKTLTIIYNGNVVWHHAMSASAVKQAGGLF
ncbi:outer membrane protein assembly factor BamE [Acetobacter conturbans]|uniref:Outer membrane protein assembly factor BamE n=1 Tax=Acetobacter conturbans TaxID=1737472 RepID=A0ABX0K5E9_9PROT|nr:outer membrane protein assembly factor BamE [Acetobacter conturbans]